MVGEAESALDDVKQVWECVEGVEKGWGLLSMLGVVSN